MFVKKNSKKVGDKRYRQYMLVESVRTPRGPRHKGIVSLGDMGPRPAKEWLKLARRVEEALIGQMTLFDESDKEVLEIVDRIRKRQRDTEQVKKEKMPKEVTVNPEEIETAEHREFGPALVVSSFWDLLNFDNILRSAGLSQDAIKLSLISVANRLIAPTSDFDTPNWARRTAICQLVDYREDELSDDKMYRLLDKLYPRREEIERELHRREVDLFNLEESIVLVDFSSLHFEGTCKRNRKAKRGYSRDKRPDLRQFVLGAAVGREGFPIATEIFEGNAQDSPTFPEMLRKIGKRANIEGRTLVFDRGIGTKKNMEFLKSQEEKHKWVMASRYWDIREEEETEIDAPGWVEIPLKGKVPGRKNPRVKVRLLEREEELLSLVWSEGRKEKDRAIRERQETKIEEDLVRLSKQIESGRLKDKEKIWKAIGRLTERYPRVARYYEVQLKEVETYQELSYWKKEKELQKAQGMDGAYLLRTNRLEMNAEEMFRTYNLLSRIENVFKDLKGPIDTQPNRHHRGDRSETHIFQSVLALHVLTAIEQTLKRIDDHRSWETIREKLRTHQMCSVVIPATNGQTYTVTKPSKMEEQHHEIYQKLGIINSTMKPKP